jgi:hypothetical protein
MGEGLCTRLYNAKIKFLSAQMCPPCLSNPDLAKIKAKVEKQFPETDVKTLERVAFFPFFTISSTLDSS